jgi:hypothetical protein
MTPPVGWGVLRGLNCPTGAVGVYILTITSLLIQNLTDQFEHPMDVIRIAQITPGPIFYGFFHRCIGRVATGYKNPYVEIYLK